METRTPLEVIESSSIVVVYSTKNLWDSCKVIPDLLSQSKNISVLPYL